MMERLRVWLPIAVVFAVIVGGFALANWPRGEDAPAPEATAEPRTATQSATSSRTSTRATSTPAPTAARRDLGRDEAAGGHTLERHVGKTDQQLRDRLDREPDISAASTFPGRETAERAVGTAIQRSEARIRTWVAQGTNRSNLAFTVETGAVVGRSMRQGSRTAGEVTSVTVVLRARGSDWYVLTSYPDE